MFLARFYEGAFDEGIGRIPDAGTKVREDQRAIGVSRASPLGGVRGAGLQALALPRRVANTECLRSKNSGPSKARQNLKLTRVVTLKGRRCPKYNDQLAVRINRCCCRHPSPSLSSQRGRSGNCCASFPVRVVGIFWNHAT